MQHNVLEVETPILSSSGNTDVNIESFTADKINSDYSKSYLRTSPEFPLKRLLCCGVGDVFELGKVFRKGEYSKTHNCEFTMLEWYRLNFNYMDLINEVKVLFDFILPFFDLARSDVKTVTFHHCFLEYLKIDIYAVSVSSLNEKCEYFGYSGSLLSKDESLDFLFATQIQFQFNPDVLTFVTQYPASQAALAKINPNDMRTSLRFEVFYQGHELGNGYQELTDSIELSKRFTCDNIKRSTTNLNPINVDHNLIEAMKNGMPKCSGIAIGVDRLLMVLLKKGSIQEVMPFNAYNS